MASAMEASQRLRAYVDDIDRFLSTSQDRPVAAVSHEDGPQRELVSQQMVIPLDRAPALRTPYILPYGKNFW